ncbi:MAG: branched-chain amino acid ABC transporter permease [Acidimicrobiales bacterium]
MSAPTTSSSSGPKPGALFTFQQGSTEHRIFQAVGWGFLVVPMFILPYILPSFRVAQLAQALGWGVAILGLNMALGWSGLLSLGHIAFTGLGAYTTAILINENDWDFWMTLPLVFGVCFIMGGIVGLPALRIRGLYLALVTFSLAFTFPILLKIEGGGIARRTGGDNGRTFDETLRPTSWMRSLLGVSNSDQSTQVNIYKYFSMLIITLVAFLLVRNVLRSRPGRAMLAVRDNQIGAAVSGVNLNKQKVLTFALSCAVAGIGGSIVAASLDSVGPTVFDANYAILTLMGLVLAGVGTLHGCWLGGLVVVFLQDFAPRLVDKVPFYDLDVIYARAIFGLILVLVAFFMPGGLVSVGRKIKTWGVRVIPKIPEPVVSSTAGQVAPSSPRAGVTV